MCDIPDSPSKEPTMRESTLIAKSSIRRASPQLRLRTGLAWGIAVAVDAWLVWLKWWCLPNTIREIIRMFPETAFLHDPAMLWQFVAASCLQSRRYRIVVSRRRKNPGALGAMAAYRDARRVRGDLHRLQRPGDRPRLRHSGIRVFSGIGCGGQSHRDRCASPWPMAAMAGAEEKARNGSLNGYSPSTAGNQSP